MKHFYSFLEAKDRGEKIIATFLLAAIIALFIINAIGEPVQAQTTQSIIDSVEVNTTTYLQGDSGLIIDMTSGSIIVDLWYQEADSIIVLDPEIKLDAGLFYMQIQKTWNGEISSTVFFPFTIDSTGYNISPAIYRAVRDPYDLNLDGIVDWHDIFLILARIFPRI